MRDAITRYRRALKNNPEEKPSEAQEYALRNLDFLFKEQEGPNHLNQELGNDDKSSLHQNLQLNPLSQENSLNLENKVLANPLPSNIKFEFIDLCDSDEDEGVSSQFYDHDYYIKEEIEDSEIEPEGEIKTELLDTVDDVEFNCYADFDGNTDYLQVPVSENDKENTMVEGPKNSKLSLAVDQPNLPKVGGKKGKGKNKSYDIQAIMHTEVPEGVLKASSSANLIEFVTEEEKIVHAAFSHVPDIKKSVVFFKLFEAHEQFRASL